jgi:hypothetical protein
MRPSRLLSLSKTLVGVEALDVRSRVRELRELAASEDGTSPEMVNIVRFLVQTELLLMISACEDAPYKAAFVVDLEKRSDTPEALAEKLMQANARDARVCIASPGTLLLSLKASLLMCYHLDETDLPASA